MRIGDLYPKSFQDTTNAVGISEKTIKEWLNEIEKYEPGCSISSGDTIVLKTKNEDYIVANEYKLLPSEIIEDKKERVEVLVDEIEDYLDEEGFNNGED